MGKVTDRGSLRKDSALFSGTWIIGGKRLTDVVPKEELDSTAKDEYIAGDGGDPEAGEGSG